MFWEHEHWFSSLEILQELKAHEDQLKYIFKKNKLWNALEPFWQLISICIFDGKNITFFDGCRLNFRQFDGWRTVNPIDTSGMGDAKEKMECDHNSVISSLTFSLFHFSTLCKNGIFQYFQYFKLKLFFIPFQRSPTPPPLRQFPYCAIHLKKIRRTFQTETRVNNDDLYPVFPRIIAVPRLIASLE